MKKKIYTLFLAGTFPLVFSQTGNVGINTPTPLQTLDVNGTARIVTTPAVTATTLSSHQLLAIDNTTRQLKEVDPGIITGNAVNTTLYAAQLPGGFSVLTASLLGGYRTVQFIQADTVAGSPALISNTDHSYTAPSTGVYAIGYYVRLGSGLQATVTLGGAGAAIIKTSGTTSTFLEVRPFAAAVVLAFTQAESNMLHTLQAGDRISFAVNPGVLALSLLTSGAASFYIYKVSN